MLLKPHYERKIMDKTTIIKTLRDMAKHPTVTLPRDTDALKAAADLLEQPEPKPVECHTCKGLGRMYMGCGSWIHCDTCNTTGKATTPPKREPEPEPVAEVRCDDGGNLTAKFHVRDLPLFSPLYTFPPRREPLTDDEIADLWRAQIFHIVDLKLAKDFVRDIEAAHGIKGEEHGTR